MTEFVVTYDLKDTNPSPHAKFKEIASKHEWHALVVDSRNSSVKYLPNTTLALTGQAMQAAVSSFNRVVAAAKLQIPNFHIERVTIVGGGEVCAFHDGEPIRY